jgi:ribosome recycling factor
MPQYDKADVERRMKGAVESLKGDLSGLRTVATVSAPEPRMLSVQVWDKSNVTPVEKAIRSAGLGLNPISDGQTLRLPIPDLTEERRKELAKLAGQYAEKAKIAIRNVRRDANDGLKTDENKKEISEDDRKRLETEVQKLTDEMIKSVDDAAANKEKEILSQ